MITRILHGFLMMLLLLPIGYQQPANTPIDPIYQIYFPLVGNGQSTATDSSKISCQIARQAPQHWTFFLPNTDFDASWTIKNISEQAWLANTSTIRFASGDRLHFTGNTIDLPYDVSPGNDLALTIKMKTPAAAGSYVSNWAIYDGSTRLCQFYLLIRVQ